MPDTIRANYYRREAEKSLRFAGEAIAAHKYNVARSWIDQCERERDNARFWASDEAPNEVAAPEFMHEASNV